MKASLTQKGNIKLVLNYKEAKFIKKVFGNMTKGECGRLLDRDISKEEGDMLYDIYNEIDELFTEE